METEKQEEEPVFTSDLKLRIYLLKNNTSHKEKNLCDTQLGSADFLSVPYCFEMQIC